MEGVERSGGIGGEAAGIGGRYLSNERACSAAFRHASSMRAAGGKDDVPAVGLRDGSVTAELGIAETTAGAAEFVYDRFRRFVGEVEGHRWGEGR